MNSKKKKKKNPSITVHFILNKFESKLIDAQSDGNDDNVDILLGFELLIL